MSGPLNKESLLTFFANPPKLAYFADRGYAAISTAWLKEFHTYFKGELWRKDLSYSKTYDCDNFARGFCADANEVHKEVSKGEALAIAEFHYRQDTGGYHAIIAAITEQGLVFMEPQNGDFLTLSQGEIDSCIFLRF